LFDRVRAYIRSHITNPDLNIGQIAQTMNCSERYIYKVFEQKGTTPDRYLWDTRLARCLELIRDASESRHTISDIAFSHGFNSSAHFSRAFKAKFGFSASELRRKEANK